MKSAIFDTNILIDALNGYPQPFTEFAFWLTPSISAITLIELHAGASLNMKHRVASLISQNGFDVIQTDDAIVEIAARIRSASVRRRAKIALADAIILATAQTRGLMVVTGNKNDFKGPNVRIPYELETITSTRVINIRPPPLP